MTWHADNQTVLSLELERIKGCLMEQIGDPSPPFQESISIELDASETDLEYKAAALEQSMSVPSALSQLCTVFRLSPFERDVLLLCVGLELDPAFAPLFAAMHGDERQTSPTFALALGLLPDADWRILATRSPLRRWQLLEVGAGRSLTASPLKIDEHILTWLTGVQQLDSNLLAWVRPIPLGKGDSAALVDSHQALVTRLVTIWQQATQRNKALPILQLCGGDGGDRQTLAALACHACGFSLHALTVATLPQNFPELFALAQRWQREAHLIRSALLLEWDDSGNETPPSATVLDQFVAHVSTPLLLSTRTRQLLGRSALGHRQFVTVDVPLPTPEEQLQLWETTLDLPTAAMNGHLKRLVGQFNLNAGMIQSAYLNALGQIEVPEGDPLDFETTPEAMEPLLWQACRLQSRQQMDHLAQRIESAATWDDLILPQAQKATLEDIAAHLRQRLKVYQEWGFAAKSQRGLGITAMFSGISGTGKTLAAEVLAQTLQLDLYKIDLSTIVSKYIGETEKNLSRVFDAAETGGAILLFDEADALFGKRNEVKDSHDRYANIEVSYLLQRMESYRGLAILTTNLPDAIDRAFLRRIRFIVSFPFPDQVEREAIWQRMFPSQTPTADLSFKKLARLNVAGGNIRNIALTAAFLAADQDEPVRMPHLLEATRREFHKLGMPLTELETKGWV